MKKFFTSVAIAASMLFCQPAVAQTSGVTQISDLIGVFAPQLKGHETSIVLITFRMNSYVMSGKTHDEVIELISKDKSIQDQTGLSEEDLAKTVALVWDVQYNLMPVYTHYAANRVAPEQTDLSKFTIKEAFRAPVDELYYGAGDERNEYNPYGFSKVEQILGKSNGATLKRNNSYAWGMGKEGDMLYFGTSSNMLCGAGIAQMLSLAAGKNLVAEGMRTDCMACDFARSRRSKEVVTDVDGTQKVLGMDGDPNVPRIYCYDTTTGLTEDITPTDGDALEILRNCQGLRSATVFNNILFIGGPTLIGAGLAGSNVAFVAYDTKEKKYIGQSHLDNVDGYTVSDIRRWVAVDGVLYCCAALTSPEGKKMGGALRWCGTKEDPFKFRLIGLTRSNAAEIAYHNGRLYIGTWPTEDYNTAEIYRGPKVTEGGIEPNMNYWESLWEYSEYESRNVGTMGGFCSFDGHLMWGTMHTAYFNALSSLQRYGQNFVSPNGLADFIATMPTGTIWAMDDSNADNGGKPTIELLYGESDFMVNMGGTGYNGDEQPQWKRIKNGMGLTPKFGRSGYGNLFMNYIWAMKEYEGKLYVGGMEDASLLAMYASVVNPQLGDALYSLYTLLGLPKNKIGNDFVCFSSTKEPAEMVSDNGLNNNMAYGIRNLETVNDALYIGTANPYNIAETGGFQIHKMQKDTEATSINAAVAEPMKLVMRKSDGYISFATTDGEYIKGIELYDVAGRMLQKETPKSNVAFVYTDVLGHGNYVIKVTTADGTKVIKVVM